MTTMKENGGCYMNIFEEYKNALKDYMTLKEVEEKYDVRADTLRSYITRKQVIPPDQIIKVGKIWYINREWIENKYGNIGK